MTTWQWQLRGSVNTTYEVDMYDIDLFDVGQSTIDMLQARGRRVICYFSAGSFESFRDDASGFNPADLGNPLSGFPDERWLDIQSEGVLQIMRQRLELAREKHCDGVEPDNVDGYVNATGFELTADDQLVFNRWIANQADERGLSVGLKNDVDQVGQLEASFDFSVNEQCHEFDECTLLAPFIEAGKPAFNAEYLNLFVVNQTAREQMCLDSANLRFSTLVLSLELDDSFRLGSQ